LIKNGHKTRLYITTSKIYYNNTYIARINNLKISHDSNTNNINIYGDSLLILVTPIFLKYPIISDIIDICHECSGKSNEDHPNIYFKEITVQVFINNHIICNLSECFFEKRILKFNAIVKVWKKEIFWIKQCIYNIGNNLLSIHNVRIRLFQSTADKIYKTFRPIYKLLIYKLLVKRKTKRSRKQSKSSQDVSHLRRYNLNTHSINNNYFNTNPSIPKDDIVCQSKYEPILDNNYLGNHISTRLKTIFKINKCTIDFQDNNGSFIFNDFTFSEMRGGVHISCSKWTFIKNNIIYLNNVNQESNFIIEYINNSLLIYPYYMYINLSIDDFSKTFSLFTSSISKIIDIFNLNIVSSNNYIFDKFYIHSTRLLFSYNTKPIQMINLLCGKYLELINTLDIHKLKFILKELTIIYPKNGDYIIKVLLKHIIDDILKNNFDILMKSTPLSMTYDIKNKISELPGFTTKCLKLFQMSKNSNK